MLCGAIASTAHAQTGWLPRTVALGPYLVGENRTVALARLESIERLLKQVPEPAHPVGFEIRDNRKVNNGSGIRLTESSSHVEIRNNPNP